MKNHIVPIDQALLYSIIKMYVAPLPCKFPGASQILQVEMPELQKENVLPEIVSVITELFPHSRSDCYIKKKKIS